MNGKVKFQKSENVWEALGVPEKELKKELERYSERVSELKGLRKTDILETLYPNLTYKELFQAIIIGDLLFLRDTRGKSRFKLR